MAYTEEQKQSILNTVCERIINGEAVRNILKDADMPAYRTFFDWIDEDEKKLQQYEKAKKSKLYIKNTKCKANQKGTKANGLSDYRVLNAKKVNKKKFPISSIYLMQIEDTSYIKIGVSQNIQRRLRDLRSSSPFNINLIYCKKVIKPYDLEDYLHEFYIEKYIKNEWFDLTKTEILNCKNIIQEWQEKKLGILKKEI